MGAVQNAESVFEKSICTQTTAFFLHRFQHFLEILKSVQGHFPPTRISGVPGNYEIGAGSFPPTWISGVPENSEIGAGSFLPYMDFNISWKC